MELTDSPSHCQIKPNPSDLAISTILLLRLCSSQIKYLPSGPNIPAAEGLSTEAEIALTLPPISAWQTYANITPSEVLAIQPLITAITAHTKVLKTRRADIFDDHHREAALLIIYGIGGSMRENRVFNSDIRILFGHDIALAYEYLEHEVDRLYNLMINTECVTDIASILTSLRRDVDNAAARLEFVGNPHSSIEIRAELKRDAVSVILGVGLITRSVEKEERGDVVAEFQEADLWARKYLEGHMALELKGAEAVLELETEMEVGFQRWYFRTYKPFMIRDMHERARKTMKERK
ncbi:hypothetical protein K432DRAFT_407878 [Lepidopterella palustris CBS 459.81]|uniref:Uncharacterized protein n=1 Tax=Lepidopterella palustris CBS 459.81 TaxID=1314670 RepID=A0A8E2E3W7_9PEZI|nr:hypothetical protein K432DRAFT_407878 [Lepidopterella palustris CBS 459.81]